MVRIILGIVAGIVLGFIAVMVAQLGVNVIYPAPRQVLDRELMTEFFRNMPAMHVMLILITYLVGGFIGSFVAHRISYSNGAAWVPAVLIALTAALNVFTYPHPVWAQVGAIAAPLFGCWLALRLPAPVPAVQDDDVEEEEAAEATRL